MEELIFKFLAYNDRTCGLGTGLNNTHMHVFYRLINLITDLFYLRSLLLPGNHRVFSDGFI